MSKSDTKEKIWKIPMPIYEAYQLIASRIIDKNTKEVIYMTYLTEEDEKELDKCNNLELERDNITFKIAPKEVICYGAIDFSNNSEDLDKLEDLTFLNNLGMRGVIIPSNYNYNEHCVYSKTKKYSYYDTTNPALVTQYIHGCLNKPNITLIFKKYKRIKHIDKDGI